MAGSDGVTERRKGKRGEERRHPLRELARLRPAGPAVERRGGERSRITVQLPAATLDRLRNAVYWTPGVTLTGFVERCVSERVDRMEQERGSTFPSRTKELKPGRPRK